MSLPTYEKLVEAVVYDPDTGLFCWRVDDRWHRAGSLAGSKSSHGYWLIGIGYRNHYAHRLAYLYMTGEEPTGVIDHIDRDTLNNRWANLRHGTQAQNLANSGIRSDNTTGFRGVHRWGGKFRAKIVIKGKQVHLGTFDNAEDAGRAYIKAAEEFHGEFAGSAAA